MVRLEDDHRVEEGDGVPVHIEVGEDGPIGVAVDGVLVGHVPHHGFPHGFGGMGRLHVDGLVGSPGRPREVLKRSSLFTRMISDHLFVCQGHVMRRVS